MDDSRILALYRKRDEAAIAATDKQYGSYCRSIAFRILQNEEDAAECVSDAYWRVWNAIPPACPPCFRLFLGKVVRQSAIHRLEQRLADKRGGGQLPVILDELEACLPSAQTPDAVTDSMVIRDTLNRFLDTLSAKDKTVFLRRYWYMDSVAEIARALHTTDNHVYVLLHRTRQKLRTMLEKEGISL